MTNEEIFRRLYNKVMGLSPAVDKAPAETPSNDNDLGIEDSQLNNVSSLINQPVKIVEGTKISLMLFERSKFVVNEHIPNAPKLLYYTANDMEFYYYDFDQPQTPPAPATEEEVINEFPKYDFTNWKPYTITVDSITGKGIRNY